MLIARIASDDMSNSKQAQNFLVALKMARYQVIGFSFQMEIILSSNSTNVVMFCDCCFMTWDATCTAWYTYLWLWAWWVSFHFRVCEVLCSLISDHYGMRSHSFILHKASDRKKKCRIIYKLEFFLIHNQCKIKQAFCKIKNRLGLAGLQVGL